MRLFRVTVSTQAGTQGNGLLTHLVSSCFLSRLSGTMGRTGYYRFYHPDTKQVTLTAPFPGDCKSLRVKRETFIHKCREKETFLLLVFTAQAV